LRSTDVLRVAPPAVVVRSVVGALQVHAREGMSGLELVIPRGRAFLRPGRGRVWLAFLPEHVPLLRFLRSHQDRASGHFFSVALRQGCRSFRQSGTIGSRQSLDSVIVRLTRRQLGPLVRDFVAWDPFVR